MKRFMGILVVLTAVLSVVLYFELRQQRLELEGPSGGSGTIEGTEVAVIAKLPARLLDVAVDEGDAVTAGQVVATLDCREAETGLAEAEAAVAATEAGVAAAELQVTLAEQGVTGAERQTRAAEAAVRATRSQRSTLEARLAAAERAVARLETLNSSGGATEQELDRARTEAEVIEEQLQALRAQVRATQAQSDAVETGEEVADTQTAMAQQGLAAARSDAARAQALRSRAMLAVEECTLRAPRDGYVEVRAYEPGELVGPGARVLTLVDTSEVTATFYLPNAELSAAEVGRNVVLVADAYPDRSFDGVISHVATSAEFTPRNVQTRDDRDRLVYGVEVAVDNPEHLLRPGMPVEVTIPGSGPNGAGSEPSGGRDEPAGEAE